MKTAWLVEKPTGFWNKRKSLAVFFVLALSLAACKDADPGSSAPETAGDTVTVTFNADGGSPASTTAQTKAGGTVSLPAAPTKASYTFSGWWAQTGGGTPFTASTTVTQSITVYAKWTIITRTVTFNAAGGTFSGGITGTSKSVAHGETVAYPEEPTKASAFFDGWQLGSAPYNYGAPVTGDVSLTAKWLTEADMTASEFAEFGATVPSGNIFVVNNNTATESGQSEWPTSWANARAAINSGGDGQNYIIKVTGNFQLAGVSNNTFTPANIKVLIYAPVSKIISLSGNGSLLYAGANQTLILRSITLQGRGTSVSNTTLPPDNRITIKNGKVDSSHQTLYCDT
jgi:uncharacterized repeat protein (TIGR02543 family)